MASYLYVPIPPEEGRSLLGPKDAVRISPSSQTVELEENNTIKLSKVNLATIRALSIILGSIGYTRIPYINSEDAFYAQTLLSIITKLPNNYLSAISRELLLHIVPFLRVKKYRIIKKKGLYYLEKAEENGDWETIYILTEFTETITSCFYIFDNIYIRTEDKLYEWEYALFQTEKRSGPIKLNTIHTSKLISYTISPTRLWINDSSIIKYYEAKTRQWHALKLPVTSVLRPIVWNEGYLYLLPGYSYTLKKGKYNYHSDIWQYDVDKNVWLKLSSLVIIVYGYPTAENITMGVVSRKKNIIQFGNKIINIETGEVKALPFSENKLIKSQYIHILPYTLPFISGISLYPVAFHVEGTTVNNIYSEIKYSGYHFWKLGVFQIFK